MFKDFAAEDLLVQAMTEAGLVKVIMNLKFDKRPGELQIGLSEINTEYNCK